MANVQDIGVRVVIFGMGEFRRNVGAVQSDMKNLESTSRTLSGSSIKLGQNLTKLGNAISGVGRTLSLTLTAPLTATLGKLISEGIEFEDAFAGVGKTVDGVAYGFRDIVAMDLAKKFPQLFGLDTVTMDALTKNLVNQGFTEEQALQQIIKSRYDFMTDAEKMRLDDILSAGIAQMTEAQKLAVFDAPLFGQLTEQGLGLRDAFRQMALEIPISVDELARVGSVAGQLGVDAGQLEEFVRVMALLGVTTDLSAEDAAFAIARFANIFGVEADDMGEFAQNMADAIVDLGNNAAATEPEILNMAMRLAATGRLTGLTETQILGLATTMVEMGVASERGGTAASRALQEMMQASVEGGDGLEAFAKIAGVSADEFALAFEEDAMGAMAMFLSGFEEFQKSGTDIEQTLLDMGLSGVRVREVMNLLAPNMDLLAENTARANRAWDENIALNEEAEKRFKTIKSQIQLVKNAFVDLGITLVDLYEEDIRNIVTKIRELIDKFRELSPEQQKNIVKWILLAIAIGPVLVVVGTLISSLGSIISAIIAVGTVMLTIGKFAVVGFSSVIKALAADLAFVNAGMWGLLVPVLAIAAMFTAAYLTNFNGFADKVDQLGESLKKFGDDPSIANASTVIKDIGAAFVSLPAGVGKAIAEFLGVDTSGVDENFTQITDSIKIIAETIWNSWDEWLGLPKVIEHAQQFLWDFGYAFLTGDYNAIWSYSKAVAIWVWKGIKDGIGSVWEWVRDNLLIPFGDSMTGDKIIELLDKAGELGAKIVKAIVDGILGAPNAIADAISGLLPDEITATDSGAGGGGERGFGNALGGPIKAGIPTLVGERGMEMFIPNTDGVIVPNHKLAQMFGGQLPNLAGQTISTTNIYSPNFYGAPSADTMDANREMLRDWQMVTQAMGAG